MSDTYDLETVSALPPNLQRLVPPLEERRSVGVGYFARLFVFVNGSESVMPWVKIVEVTPTGYVGEVGGIANSPDWLPYGTRVAFTADNIIEL